jgi:hypothetical protein
VSEREAGKKMCPLGMRKGILDWKTSLALQRDPTLGSLEEDMEEGKRKVG